MKNRFFIALSLGSLLLTISTSCKKETTINFDYGFEYTSQNHHLFTPNATLFYTGDTNKARVILEEVNLMHDFDLFYRDTPTRKNHGIGLHKVVVQSKEKEIDVPITNLYLSSIAITNKSYEQLGKPIQDYLEKVEVIIYPNDLIGVNAGSESGSVVLAICENLNCFAEDSLQTSNINGYDIVPSVTKFDLVNFIEEHPDYSIEIVGTFHEVPEEIRLINYSLTFRISGDYISK